MQCLNLVVTIFLLCCYNHFTSFVTILLFLTMVYNEFIILAIYVQYEHGKNSLLCSYIGLAISTGFFLNGNEYWITENRKI